MIDAYLRAASVVAWLICLACLAPAVWRLIRHKGRSQDPIWAVVFLLALNRISFIARVSAEISYVTAIALALIMAGFSRWYQRHDR